METSLLEGIRTGDRRSLSKAITIIESSLPKDRSLGENLLQSLPKNSKLTYRIGFSGPPGAGKSSLIETLGLYLIEKGHRVAVLAIDPTSPTSGGSLLGDKTRMERLSRSHSAFIRPSSSTKNYLGGIAPRTPEVISLLEAANFDVIFLETIGIGQNEVDAFDTVDMLLLILSPGAGDELQGLKKGILELVHMIVVNKWDGDLKQAAELTYQHYQAALMNRTSSKKQSWIPCVLKCSARDMVGIENIWREIENFYHHQASHIKSLRGQQQEKYFYKLVHQDLLQLIHTTPEFNEKLAQMGQLITSNDLTPRQACSQFIQQITEKLFSCIKNNV